MNPVVVVKALVVWLAILLLAMLNGLLREATLAPALGSPGAPIASGIILTGAIVLVACLAAPWYGTLAPSQWWLIGLFWLLLTSLFELGFGRLVQHRSWPEMSAAYTFERGNLWPLVLVATLISPWLAARWRGLV